MRQDIVFTIVKGLHIIGTSIWVGGLIILCVVVMPAMKKVNNFADEKKIILNNIYKRLTMLVFLSIPVLFITGVLLGKRSGSFHGFFNFGNLYSLVLSIKLVLVIAMIVIIFLRKQSLKKFMKLKDTRYAKKANVYVPINMIIGIIVIFLSSFCTAIG